MCTEEHVTVTRNLPSGQNIFETITTKYALQKDGTKKKIVVKGQAANITKRKRESGESGDLTGVKRKVSEAERRQAKNISDILNHISGDNENASLFTIHHSREVQENKYKSQELICAALWKWLKCICKLFSLQSSFERELFCF